MLKADQGENKEMRLFCAKCGGKLKENLFCENCGDMSACSRSPITKIISKDNLQLDECSEELSNSGVSAKVSVESQRYDNSNSNSTGIKKKPLLIGLIIVVPIIALIIGFLVNGGTGRKAGIYVDGDSPLYEAEIGDIWFSTGGAAGGFITEGYVVTSKIIMTVPDGTEVSFVYGEDNIQRSNDEYYYCVRLPDGTVGFIELSRIVQIN